MLTMDHADWYVPIGMVRRVDQVAKEVQELSRSWKDMPPEMRQSRRHRDYVKRQTRRETVYRIRDVRLSW